VQPILDTNLSTPVAKTPVAVSRGGAFDEAPAVRLVSPAAERMAGGATADEYGALEAALDDVVAMLPVLAEGPLPDVPEPRPSNRRVLSFALQRLSAAVNLGGRIVDGEYPVLELCGGDGGKNQFKAKRAKKLPPAMDAVAAEMEGDGDGDDDAPALFEQEPDCIRRLLLQTGIFTPAPKLPRDEAVDTAAPAPEAPEAPAPLKRARTEVAEPPARPSATVAAPQPQKPAASVAAVRPPKPALFVDMADPTTRLQSLLHDAAAAHVDVDDRVLRLRASFAALREDVKGLFGAMGNSALLDAAADGETEDYAAAVLQPRQAVLRVLEMACCAAVACPGVLDVPADVLLRDSVSASLARATPAAS
jgi:hypothetical protein